MNLSRLAGVAAVLIVIGITVAKVPFAAGATKCGTDEPITVADMTWPSASVMAEVTAIVLKDGFDCAVQLVPGNTVPTAQTMLTSGKPDIAPEFWASLVEDVWDSLEQKGTVLRGSVVYPGGSEQGFWVPDYFYNAHPGVRAITDLKDNWKYFASSVETGKGQIYSCPPGWGCEVVNANIFRALGLGGRFEFVLQGSVANTSAVIARKVALREAFVVYGWTPSNMVAKYSLVKLDAPTYDPTNYPCLTDPYCAEPKLSGWKRPEIIVAVMKSLQEKASQPVEALMKLSVPNDVILKVLKWGDDNDKEPDEMAEYFFRTFEDVWTSWVPVDVAESIKAGGN